MTCTSNKCSGKTHFCNVCGVELTEAEHHSHFTEGPFIAYCKNKKRGDDAEYDKFIAKGGNEK